jgi:hypothetical protein
MGEGLGDDDALESENFESREFDEKDTFPES